MKSFSKPRKLKPVFDDSTPYERELVEKRLRKKYPQMYEEGWGKPGKTGKTESGLRRAGISSDEMPTDEERRKRNKGK